MNQSQQVLNLIKRDGSITRLTAMHYGIANLTARIADLRREGHAIRCVEKVDAKGRTYGVWKLPKEVKAPAVGDRIRVTSTPKNDGAFYSKGAEGRIIEASGRFPSYPICVQFDSGEYDNSTHAFDTPANGCWWVRAGEFEVL
jgi:hypothetical protein